MWVYSLITPVASRILKFLRFFLCVCVIVWVSVHLCSPTGAERGHQIPWATVRSGSSPLSGTLDSKLWACEWAAKPSQLLNLLSSAWALSPTAGSLSCPHKNCLNKSLVQISGKPNYHKWYWEQTEKMDKTQVWDWLMCQSSRWGFIRVGLNMSNVHLSASGSSWMWTVSVCIWVGMDVNSVCLVQGSRRSAANNFPHSDLGKYLRKINALETQWLEADTWDMWEW